MERWRIRKEEATATVLATTQRLVRSLLEPTLNRRYKTNDRMLRYHDGNFNSNLNIPEDPTVENTAMGICEVGVRSIMMSVSPTLEPWSLSSDLEGEFGICGVSSG